eukprot:6201858-Pleurochrysis_carterae.AAC.2
MAWNAADHLNHSCLRTCKVRAYRHRAPRSRTRGTSASSSPPGRAKSARCPPAAPRCPLQRPRRP